MTIALFLEKLNNTPEIIEFNEVITLIDENYSFTPKQFQNGNITNEVGENNGSCKIFSLAKILDLTKDETLACFGNFYRNDVLENPQGKDHLNIRNFMKFGWYGMSFEGNSLIAK